MKDNYQANVIVKNVYTQVDMNVTNFNYLKKLLITTRTIWQSPFMKEQFEVLTVTINPRL